eukprot:PhM_4_TR8470/c3_g1_i4/m.104116
MSFDADQYAIRKAQELQALTDAFEREFQRSILGARRAYLQQIDLVAAPPTQQDKTQHANTVDDHTTASSNVPTTSRHPPPPAPKDRPSTSAREVYSSTLDEGVLNSNAPSNNDDNAPTTTMHCLPQALEEHLDILAKGGLENKIVK